MPATARPTQAHSHAGGQAGAKPKLYNPRHPERTLLYQTIAEHFETWFELASAGQFDGQGERRRILRAFVGRGLLESCDAKEMLAYQHSGFSVDAGVCIEADDRAALERLLRYCARPPFAMDRLRKEGCDLVYRCAKQHSEPGSDKRGAKVDEITLTPLELIDRIAALVPPPRTHRHRYFGVLAPNSPLRAAVTALAQPAKQVVV